MQDLFGSKKWFVENRREFLGPVYETLGRREETKVASGPSMPNGTIQYLSTHYTFWKDSSMRWWYTSNNQSTFWHFPCCTFWGCYFIWAKGVGQVIESEAAGNARVFGLGVVCRRQVQHFAGASEPWTFPNKHIVHKIQPPNAWVTDEGCGATQNSTKWK